MSPRAIKVLLLVEDSHGDAGLLRRMFKEGGSDGTELTHVESLGEAEEYLAKRTVDIIVFDLGLPDGQGLEGLRRARAAAPRTPLVVLTGRDDESLAARALQEGAQDYLVKGQSDARALLRALRNAIERKTLEDALFLEKERAQVTLNCIGDAVVCTDISGNVTFLNVVAERLTGWSLREAAGRTMDEVIPITHASARVVHPNLVSTGTGRNAPSDLPRDRVVVRPDGVEVPIEDSVAIIRDRKGHAAGRVVVLRDVSEARAQARQTTHSAQHDHLTGLPNRILFNDRVNQAIALARRHSKNVAVLFLDLDGFKHINDSLGHPFGDKLLQSVARRLLDCLRVSDTVSRQGGDEFVVLLSEVERAEDAAVTARRMLTAVATSHLIDQHDIHLTASIGISAFPDDGQDAETLIKNADTAMYQAKENGRQGYKLFKPAMNIRAVERQSIEESLRLALDRGEFALHYQPQIDLGTGAITGAEALIRWTHPSRGPVSPVQFIPIAEECGLIVPIGRWVLGEACRQARAWVDLGLPMVRMAVNISAAELRHDAFLDGVFAVLEETGLDPKLLELELTESVLMKHAEASEFILRKLRAGGVQLAVDDFGTGYSSLSYLRRFAIDTLKIDQSFIRQITAASGGTTIVAAVIGIGRSLKLQVVAEGVETLEELLFLRAHECDAAQGFYLSRPLHPEQFSRLLEDGLPEAVFNAFESGQIRMWAPTSGRARVMSGGTQGGSRGL